MSFGEGETIRYKIVHHHRWIQRPGILLALLLIMLAFLAMVQQSRGPKMRRRVQQAQAHITMPTGSIPNAHNVFWIRSGSSFHVKISIEHLFCYRINMS